MRTASFPGVPRARWIRATLVAPVAAPAVVWVGFLVAAIASTHHVASGINPVAGSLFLAFALFVFGFPAALIATIVILLPVSILAERYRAVAWPIFVAIGAVAGGVIMPAFLHWLEPRGHISMWPGAGVVAGAAVALLFWRISRQTFRDSGAR